MRTVFWDYEQHALNLIDQRLLPGKLVIVSFRHPEEVVNAIRNMTVRGAPAIGATAAFGMALAGFVSKATNLPDLRAEVKAVGNRLKAARPTAVNLAWAVDRVMSKVTQFRGDPIKARDQILAVAQRIADQDVETNLQMAVFGAELIQDGDTIIHHCNTGALAVVDWGTALGVIRKAYEQGKKIHVLVDETRPRLQGARLTAWELGNYHIPYDIITDGMAGHFLHTGRVQKVFFGGDRMAMNGDLANKVGTYMLAVAAHENKVPVYAVVPTSTIDPALSDGSKIPIEERDPAEVLDIQINGERAVPEGATALNPAFDVTPARYLTAIVTEKGIIRPPFTKNIPKMLERAGKEA